MVWVNFDLQIKYVEDRINELENSFGYGSFLDGLNQENLDVERTRLKKLTQERDSNECVQ